MTGLGQLLGHGTPAEQARIRHDLNVYRRHGGEALRQQLDGEPVSAALWVALIAQTSHRASLRDRISREDFAREEQHQDDLRTRQGGNR